MSFKTTELMDAANSLPKDEASVNTCERKFADEQSATEYFENLKWRILDLEEWNRNSGMSDYAKFDQAGREIDGSKPLEIGDFIRITLTGTGKSDWVRIKNIYESSNEIVVTVKPTFDPTAEPQDEKRISHFFAATSTNNFCAYREDRAVHFGVIGLNETLNSDDTAGMVETARNVAVANLGYYLGIQKAEWKKFCNSFLGIAEAAADQ